MDNLNLVNQNLVNGQLKLGKRTFKTWETDNLDLHMGQ